MIVAASSEVASRLPERSSSEPRRPGTGTLSVCWLIACEESAAPCTPCSQKARETITRKAKRKQAKRSPIRRSIRRTFPLPRFGEALGGFGDDLRARVDHQGLFGGRHRQAHRRGF